MKASASAAAHDLHPSIDRGGWKRHVKARMLCGGDQTCCCIARTVKRRVIIPRIHHIRQTSKHKGRGDVDDHVGTQLVTRVGDELSCALEKAET